MNRRRSNDSLDNEMDDAGSSSSSCPTNYNPDIDVLIDIACKHMLQSKGLCPTRDDDHPQYVLRERDYFRSDGFTRPSPEIPCTARMCAKFVECRSLVEAIDLVAMNRDSIEHLTEMVTRDGSIFHAYDTSKYEIDYSVKETFNQQFWHDRVPVITTADGNCQYHAVSLGLTGSEAYTQEVRLAAVMAVIDHRDYFDSVLKLIDGGSVLDLVHKIARSYSWGDETTLKAVAVAIKRRIFLYTCNAGKKDYELVRSLGKDELLEAFKEAKYRGGTGIHSYADPLCHVAPSNYIMLFHKSSHFCAVLPTVPQPTMFEPYNPIVPTLG